MSWTISMSITAPGDYDHAQDIATALERLAKRKGAEDPMIEIHEQVAPRERQADA